MSEEEKIIKEQKKEIQNLRTELNLYKKCVKKIHYDIEHLKKDSYDYGEAAEDLLVDIKDQINQITSKILDFQIKAKIKNL